MVQRHFYLAASPSVDVRTRRTVFLQLPVIGHFFAVVRRESDGVVHVLFVVEHSEGKEILGPDNQVRGGVKGGGTRRDRANLQAADGIREQHVPLGCQHRGHVIPPAGVPRRPVHRPPRRSVKRRPEIRQLSPYLGQDAPCRDGLTIRVRVPPHLDIIEAVVHAREGPLGRRVALVLDSGGEAHPHNHTAVRGDCQNVIFVVLEPSDPRHPLGEHGVQAEGEFAHPEKIRPGLVDVR